MNRFVKKLALIGLNIAIITLAMAPACVAGDAPFTPMMRFADAVKAYSGSPYNKDGYVGGGGKVKGDGLGCSAFVSVVMHQLRYGKEYFNNKNWDWRLYQKVGKDIAEKFELRNAGEFEASALSDNAKSKTLLDSGKLKAEQVYLFDAHPGSGHTGFLRLKSSGEIEQWHYSGMAAYNGLATGDFHTWVTASEYKAGKFTLFVVPE